MHYVSTRGGPESLSFTEATLAGLALDGGLYVPTSWPRLSVEQIARLRGLSYADTAVAIMSPFIGDDIDSGTLRSLCNDAYGGFDHVAVTPLVQLDQRRWILELFHGPTHAFKDIALQFLGRLFDRFLSAKGQRLTVIAATSGDTGSAAIAAVAGSPWVDLFVLHPQGRISEIQRRQMTTVSAPNVHNIAIEGNFDDAQALVKSVLADVEMMAAFNLGAVNSINWSRLMAQIVYYFYAAVRLGAPDTSVAFSVPTGNFGDVFAGYVAAQMGLPIARLIVATNANDIVHRALSRGDYSVQKLMQTAAPSMDIQVSSNFERLLYDLLDRDGAALASTMQKFEASRGLVLPEALVKRAGYIFTSAAVDGDAMRQAMRSAFETTGILIDPHTAIGLAATNHAVLDPGTPVVVLATAHPAKFEVEVEQAVGRKPLFPPQIEVIRTAPERYEILPSSLARVKNYIRSHVGNCA
jgi:threonine synthase